MATIFASRVAVSARPLTRASSSKEEKVRASPPPSRVARVGAPVVILERHRNDEKNGRRRASLTVSIPTRASRKPQPAAASLPKRALSGLVAASLSGREVAFEPMLKGAEGHGGSPIALELPDGRLRLSEGNAIARYLGGDALAPADATTRWKSERWQEWESTTLSPAVALACASKDVAPLAALLASSLDVALGAAGGGVSVSICGGDDVTLADVVVFIALYPVFADGGAAIEGPSNGDPLG